MLSKGRFVTVSRSPVPTSIDATLALLASAEYLADRSLATVLFLALRMGRPLFLEGEAGVGKTEIAKVLSATLGRRLIRLQCYEGLDVAAAVYEWNYAAQMIAIRLAEAEGRVDRDRLSHDVFSENFLIKRPLLQALEPDPDGAPVLLIDELDRTDEAFEAFLLEVLADYQVTIPELGTVTAAHPPIVVITSNRTREIHDALKRRCLYHWVGYPDAERELAIVRAKVPGIAKRLSQEVVHFVQALRRQDLFKSPGVAETLDWATRAHRARRHRARSGDGVGHARRAPQVPGRHRAHRGQQGEGADRRPARRVAGGGVTAPVEGGASEGRLAENHGRLAENQGRLAENIVYFARALHAAGIPVGPGAVRDALEAVAAAGVGNREDFYWTLHAVFVKKHEHTLLFDQAFRIFFRKRGLLDQLMAMLLPQVEGAPHKPQAGSARIQEALFSGLKDKPQEREVEIDSRLTVSDRELLQTKDFAQMSADEIARAKEAIRRMVLSIDAVKTRRLTPDRHGHVLDMRRTLRASMKAGGALIDLRYRGRKTRQPPIVALLDISGSMGEYTRLFLHFLHAVTDARKRVHSFLFGTRLTNITRALKAKDPDEALAAVSASVVDWSGGTRIATSLHVFNKQWARRVLSQGAIVVLITDGLERDPDDRLAFEMDRLHRSSRRLIWLNPLLRFEGFSPKARGVQAMLPHVDEFRPIHNLRSMEDLCRALSGKGAGQGDPKGWLRKVA